VRIGAQSNVAKSMKRERHFVTSTANSEGVEQRLMEHPLFADQKLRLVCRHKNRWSEILEYRRGSERIPSIVVKRTFYPGTPVRIAEVIHREYQSLLRVHELAGEHLKETVPLPLLVLPDANALAMSKLPGVPLSTVLQRKANRLTGSIYRGEICEVASRIGQWLANFHEASRQDPVLFDAHLYLAELDQRLTQSAEAGLDVGVRHDIFELARHTSEKLNGRETATAARHGDFMPQNILVNDPSVSVVDFSDFRPRGVIYEDLGNMVAYLSRLETDRFYSRHTVAATLKNFLAGYARPISIDLLYLYVLKGMVTNFVYSPRRTKVSSALRIRGTLAGWLVGTSRKSLGELEVEQ
jgi:hypothetical protein